MKRIHCLVLITALFITSVEAAVRCPSGKIVKKGDKTFEVLTKCGEPSYRERFGLVTIDGKRVNMERWVYVPGKSKFTKYLDFHNGVLTDISNGPRAK